jgi:hypothetical protein
MFFVLGQDRKNRRLDGVLVERIAFLLLGLQSKRTDGGDVRLHSGFFFRRLWILERKESLKPLDGVEEHVEQLLTNRGAGEP